MNAKDPSLNTLLQLKGLLDSGAVTRQEFNLLKRKLLGNSFADEPEFKNDKESLPTFPDSAAEETIISPDSLPARQVTIYSAAPPAVEKPVAGEDAASHHTITRTSLPGASNPENPVEPPRLEIDHLLMSDEPAPSVQLAPLRWAVPTSPTSSTLPTPVTRNGTIIRPERKWKEPVKFAPFAFSLKEQEDKWKKALNVATVFSVLVLAAFGGFLFQNQRGGMESEQISSRTQSAGGLAPLLGEEEDSPVDAPTDLRAFKSKAVAKRPTSPPETRQQPPVEPDTPPAAQEQEPKIPQEPETPIDPPVNTDQIPAVPEETIALDTESEQQEEQASVPEAVDPDSLALIAPAAEQVAPEPVEEKVASEPVEEEEKEEKEEKIAFVPAREKERNTEPAVNPLTFPGRDSYDEYDQAILDEIEDRLRAFYVDFQEKPFDARKFFAPRVERFYTLTNTTPRDINKNLENYHYSEFLDSRSSFDPASIRIVNRDDVIYEVVYIEQGRSFRKSRNQHQETKAQVRARFNPDFKMTYLRQERLLKNEFYE